MKDQTDNNNFDSNLDARLGKLEASTRAARWWRRTALGLIALAISFPLVANALNPVPNMFVSGEVVSASKMNDNFAHLQNAITAVETRLAALESQPVLPSCDDGKVAYRTSGSWTCENAEDIVDVDVLLRTKLLWGIVSHNPSVSSTHCAVEESSLAGVTCTFSNGTFTVNTPGWTTHYTNDVITANASWCQSCSNLGLRVDPLSSTQSIVLSLSAYNSGTARVNFILLKK